MTLSTLAAGGLAIRPILSEHPIRGLKKESPLKIHHGFSDRLQVGFKNENPTRSLEIVVNRVVLDGKPTNLSYPTNFSTASGSSTSMGDSRGYEVSPRSDMTLYDYVPDNVESFSIQYRWHLVGDPNWTAEEVTRN